MEVEDIDLTRSSLGRLFRAAEDLKAELSVDEPGFAMLAPEAHPNSRDFYIFESLDEVQKMTCALLPLCEIYASKEEEGDSGDPTNRIITEAFADQSALWQRKLVEILAELVCFRTTPGLEYYRDYLLLSRLDQVLGVQADQRSFWAVESQNFAHQIRSLQTEIEEVEAKGLDLTRAWYRKEKMPLRVKPHAGTLFASFKERLMHALDEANDTEKVALGLSYGTLFGRASTSVHARPGRLTHPERAEFLTHLRIPTLLGINVLVACQTILEKVPGEHNSFFRRALERNTQAMEQVGRMTEQRAQVGDLVFAHGDLCEVLEVASGPYGYKAYKVRYLTRRLLPEIAEDYVVAQQVAVILNASQAREMLKKQVEDGNIPPDVADRMLGMSESELIALFRDSTVDLWKADIGLKESITERLTGSPQGETNGQP